MKMFRMMTVILFLAGIGCQAENPRDVPASGPTNVKRFKVESFGEFYGGYGNNRREIFIVTDTETSVQYLAITGCGTTQMREEYDGHVYNTKEE